MTRHSVEEARERAALYAAGALPAQEALDFETHLETGCAVCRAEVATFASVAQDLAHAAPPQSALPSLRARVLDQVATASALARQPVFEKEGVSFVRPTALDWEDGHAPGIDIKILSVDRERGYITKLVRMQPGASLQPHRHADVEESYLLEGDLLVSGVLMHAGDYCRAEADSVHTGVTTQGGCLFIAVYSERDQLLA